MKNRILAVVKALALLTMACLVQPTATRAEIKEGHSRKTAPAFSLKDSAGTTVRLSDYEGRVVLLNFWATWCHGCVSELPWYVEFQHKYKDRGFAVIAASMDDDGWKVVKPFMDEKKLNFTVVLAADGLPEHYGLSAMPMSVLIDREGRIADSHAGVVERDEWEGEIQKLLAESRKDTRPDSAKADLRAGERAPDFELHSLSGPSVRLSSLRGKPVLLNFWATWCAPCRVEMPWLVEFHKRYQSRGLEIVGISMDDAGEEKAVAEFVKERDVRYTILHGSNTVADSYGGVRYLPQTFFIDAEGNIVKTTFGIDRKDDFENGIRQLLAAGGRP